MGRTPQRNVVAKTFSTVTTAVTGAAPTYKGSNAPIDLTADQIRAQLLRLGDLVEIVVKSQPTIGSRPKEGWFNHICYEIDPRLVAPVGGGDSQSSASPAAPVSAIGSAPPLTDEAGKGACAECKLYASVDGFWFVYRMSRASEAITTAVSPWAALISGGDQWSPRSILDLDAG